MNQVLRWDIFCAVVDNYGDIGVCWRLARQLSNEHGLQVRLWADDLTPLVKLRPDADATLDEQHIDNVEVRRWSKTFPDVAVADIVIEAFGCHLPENYIGAMAATDKPSVWINLEYLSAESWVEGTHRLPSPHPRLPLTKYFFFPGFTAKTGGLMREADYSARKLAFDAAAFRARLGLPTVRDDELTISLFGYENTALPGLLDAWSQESRPVTCLVPEGRLLPQVQAFFGDNKSMMQRENLTVHAIPFLSQQEYDALLWFCDLNFVRGEDSFVRAQCAEKPFVWHIYPQEDAAHIVKLNAFLDRYLVDVPASAAAATRGFWTAWNENADAGKDWPTFSKALFKLQQHSPQWAAQLQAVGDLSGNLWRFAQEIAAK